MSNRDTRQLIRRVRTAGGVIKRDGNNHFQVFFNGRRIGTISNTPSDWRSHKNEIARLRRNGLGI